ncbi:MAG: ParB/RepB/Spo0J family partition protein [Oscillospiraceae bacterium]|nr:ParB/RepB/Spo0J family partition protein [Oscillospiraceae bacterium]
MALGAGLEAVFADNSLDSSDVMTLRVSEIEPNKGQPRKNFDENSIRELADSIKEHGLIQPIIVRPTGNGMTYQIVAGERRWRACRILKMDEVPVIIKDLTDSEVAQISIIENVQRADLDPVEEAVAYRELMESYEMTQERVAEAVGKSRSYIANSLRLLNLPSSALEALQKGNITVGHAKALLSAETEEGMKSALTEIVKDGLNVRQTEKLVKGMKESKKETPEKPSESRRMKNYYAETEIQIMEAIGRRAKITGDGSGRGTISVDFYDKDDLYKLASGIVEILKSE